MTKRLQILILILASIEQGIVLEAPQGYEIHRNPIIVSSEFTFITVPHHAPRASSEQAKKVQTIKNAQDLALEPINIRTSLDLYPWF